MSAFDEKLKSNWDRQPDVQPGKSFNTTEEERIERATLERQLTSLVINSHANPLHVTSIRVEGAKHTKPWVIEKYIQPILSATTLGDVIVESRQACVALSRLDIFKKVGVVLDGPPGDHDVSGGKDAVQVVIQLEEKPRIWAKTGTEIGNYEGNMNASLNLRNVFGGGESLEGNVTYGVETNIELGKPSIKPFTSQTGSSFQGMFTKPLNADPDTRLDLSIFKLSRNLALFSSHEERTQGALARLKFLSPLGNHEIGYDVAWRQVTNLSPNVSFSVRQDAGHTLKSSIGHLVVRDTRDDRMLSSRGYYFRAFQELAGLGGDVRHVKAEVEGQGIVPLGFGFNITASARGGALFPLGTTKTRINDRFFVGGPLTVRGFRQNGIGPRDGNDSIGGDAYWAAGLSLFSPLPYLRHQPIKAHAFVNAGSSRMLDPQSTPQSKIQNLFSTPSVSAGAGLAVRFSILRLEVNYCVPVAMTTSDVFKRGIQFGVGLQFM